jgi:hypothetical protein
LIAFVVHPDPSTGVRFWQGWDVLVRLALVAVGAATVVSMWTSRLVLSGGTLTATNFFVSRSMPLTDVMDVDWSALPWMGGKIRDRHRHGIRTLVSGRTWDELWTTRAEKIEREILSLAKASRGEAAD